jgi:hypothetical protein
MLQFTEMNVNDLNKLRHLRIERLIGLFSASLPFCLIQVDADDVLFIHCYHNGILNKLMSELEDLCYYSCLIVGVKFISLHSLNREVLRVDAFII